MAVVTLATIKTKLSDAVTSTAGLESLEFTHISELTTKHNVSYPCLVFDIPDTTELNFNRDVEKYAIEVYVLDLNSSHASFDAHYDSTKTLMRTWYKALLDQNNLDIIIEREDIDIERVQNITPDIVSGVMVKLGLTVSFY
tara:strand:+ start:12797 stop:13219 length:423 start_codon:yes stop_codon:yes gene_type:complete